MLLGRLLESYRWKFFNSKAILFSSFLWFLPTFRFCREESVMSLKACIIHPKERTVHFTAERSTTLREPWRYKLPQFVNGIWNKKDPCFILLGLSVVPLKCFDNYHFFILSNFTIELHQYSQLKNEQLQLKWYYSVSPP